MKLTTGLQLLGAKDIKNKISKKVLLANTQDKIISQKIINKGYAQASDPLYIDNPVMQAFNPDIRYRNMFNYSALTGINYRNDLLIFAENSEIKKAVNIVANETAIIDTENSKYPISPYINLTQVEADKIKVAKQIQVYLDEVFYPKLMQMYNFKDEGFIEAIEEFLICGKLAFEIIFDNLKRPKNIIGIQPIDPATLQKFKSEDHVFYLQRQVSGDTKERILHENQIILIEWNKYDFGYISYVDKLRRAFNIMRSMQTSKVLWFAAKSQVKLHVKLALGDVSNIEAKQKLIEAKNQYTNQFQFREDGVVLFNNQPNNNAYREFFTAETSASNTPEIEEVNSNGPDLTETDSLGMWQKLFWNETEIPYDRIDPNAGDSWGFTDVSNLRKIEINFAKFINRIRKLMNPLFLKPIIIQLTLQETEIGLDLSLLDLIKMRWIAFNQYESLAELELMGKRVEVASNISNFGDLEDVNGNVRKMIPVSWMLRNYLQLTEEQIKSIEKYRKIEQEWLGFDPDETPNYMEEDHEIQKESMETQTEMMEKQNKTIDLQNTEQELALAQSFAGIDDEDDDAAGIEDSDNSELE